MSSDVCACGSRLPDPGPRSTEAADYAASRWRSSVESLYDAAARDGDLEVCERTAGLKGLDHDLHATMSRSRRVAVRRALAANHDCAPDVLAKLAASRDRKVSVNAVCNPSTPPEARVAAVSNAGLDLLRILTRQILNAAEAPEALVQACVSSHHAAGLAPPCTSKKQRLRALSATELRQAVDDATDRKLALWQAADNPNCPQDLLDEAARTKDPGDCAVVAANPNTSEATLEWMVREGAPWSDAALQHRNCPESALRFAASQVTSRHVNFKGLLRNLDLPADVICKLASTFVKDEPNPSSRFPGKAYLFPAHPKTPPCALETLVHAGALTDELRKIAAHGNATDRVLDLIPTARITPASRTIYTIAGNHLVSVAQVDVALGLWDTWDGSVATLLDAARRL